MTVSMRVSGANASSCWTGDLMTKVAEGLRLTQTNNPTIIENWPNRTVTLTWNSWRDSTHCGWNSAVHDLVCNTLNQEVSVAINVQGDAHGLKFEVVISNVPYPQRPMITSQGDHTEPANGSAAASTEN